MKQKHIFPLLLSSQLLFSNTEYDKFFPPHLTGNITATAKTNCSYASANKDDCFFGLDYGSGLQRSFEYDGEGKNTSLNVTGSLGEASSTNKNMDMYFSYLKVVNTGNMSVDKFHTIIVSSSMTLDNHSTLILNMEDKDSTRGVEPKYGNDAKLIFTDFLYGSSNNTISNHSKLEIKNGNLMLGATTLVIDKTSKLIISRNKGAGKIQKRNAKANNTGDIYNRGHIINNGYINVETLHNGFSHQGVIPGINLENTSGRVDNYGFIDGSILNDAKSTFVFHSMDGKMSKVGSMDNKANGNVIIDVDGVSYTTHKLVNNGDQDMNATIRYSSGASEFITATMSSTNKQDLEVSLKKDTVEKFEEGFNGTKKDILNALDSRYNIYSKGGSRFILKAVDNITNGISNNYIAAPLALIDTLKPSLIIGNDGVRVGLLGAGYFGSDIGIGGLGGISINYNLASNNNVFQAQIGYGYGSIKNNSDISNNSINANLVMLSLMNQTSLNNNLDIYTGLHSSVGFFNAMQYIDFNNVSYSKRADSSFNLYSINLDFNLGYRFKFGNYLIKPFLGLNQEVDIQSSFSENGGLAINANGHTNYTPYALLGIENRYELLSKSIIFARVNYERMLSDVLNKVIVYSDKEKITLTSPYENKLGIEVGGDIMVNNNIFIGINGFYKTNVYAIHYLGGNASFKYVF